MSLAEEMMRYRATQRISQAEMARRCGVTVQTICNVENEVQVPSKMTRMKIRMEIEKGSGENR